MTNVEALKIQHHTEMTLLRIRQMLDLATLSGQEQNMAVDPKVAALITEFDTATDAIAARIQRLIDAGGLNSESQAALQAEVDKLTQLGKDPSNPVP
jgi:hypothetical protein